MSNDYFQYQAAKFQQAELARSAEQHRIAQEASRQAKGAQPNSGAEKGGARRAHLRGVRLFGRSPRPTAC